MENSCFPSLALILLLNISTLTSSAALFNSTTDQLALLAFKNTITSDPLALLASNWSANASVCNWIGVTCSAEPHRVTALNISRFGLGGTIPAQVGSLTFLRSLDASFNHFAGGIPSSLFNISGLQILDISHNFLYGDIPEEIGNLPSLEILNLGYNNLRGSVPKGIFNAPSLVRLILTNNKLSNNIPSDVCNNTPRLKIISFSVNQLSGEIPSNIWKCRELEVLSLSANRLNGSIPGEIGSLSMLSELFMGSNHLEGSIPEQIGNLTSLKYMDLRGNYLKGSVPSSIFSISNLVMLDLSFNQFDGTLPSNMGISLFNLDVLRLSGNRFSGTIPSSIINASKLTILEMNQNSFTGYIPDFGDLKLLRILRISMNYLTAAESTTQELGFLSSLTSCRHLEVLDVSENPLNGIIPTVSIGNLSTSLKWFRAGGCNINGVIPPEIGNLSSLLGLYLYENQLQGHTPHRICQMTSLAELDLSANMLSGPIPECFGVVGSLRTIHLGSNKLNSTIPSNFWDLNKLLILNLSSNYLVGNLSTQVGNLKAIYRMDLSSNKFSGNIPSSFDGCQSLETLSLSNNMLTGSIPQSLGSVRGLGRLDLSYNNLSGLIPESLEKLGFLEQFNVSDNSLEGEIPNKGPFINFTAQSFMDNPALCGSSRFQVPPCMTNHARSSSRSKDIALLIVYIVASFISVFIWVVIIFVLTRIPLHSDDHRRHPSHDDHTSVGVSWRPISYRELVQVTSGFSEANLLGRGGVGSVYKGELSDGLYIAVKVFNMQLEVAARCFDTETEILRSIRHRNLIRVIGCCTNTEFRALVLAYMPNGSLEKCLYSETYCLDLVQRLNIAIDVASALEYLHHHHTFPVAHCDIKPSNVLLDYEMTAQVSDLGFAKLFDQGEDVVQTTAFGTVGYIPPEFGVEGIVSTKGDVYSYGVMLLELFTRKKPTDNMFNGEMGLREWVCDAIDRNAIHKVVDPALLSTVQVQHFLPREWACEGAIERNNAASVDPALHSIQDQPILPKVLLSVFYLAIKCLAYSPHDRIDMIEAAYILQKIKHNVDSEMTRKSSPYYSIAESPPLVSQTTSSQLSTLGEEQGSG